VAARSPQPAQRHQRFGPTSGQLTGWTGVGLMVFFVGWLLVVERDLETAVVLAAVGVLMWCFLLRPRVLLGPEQLVLRNAFSDWLIPLRLVEDVVVRQVTVVHAGEHSYQGVGVGRPLRRLLREHPGREPVEPDTPTRASAPHTDAQVPDFMVRQVLERVAALPPSQAGGQVRREYAVPELVALVVLVVLFAVLVLV
jgi:hypothetical protein